MIKRIIRNELFRSSMILFFLFNIVNFINFIFQFAMARFLGPIEYSVFAVIMSIIYVISIPSETLQTIIANYSSQFNSERDYGKIKGFILKIVRKGIIITSILFFFSLFLFIFLSKFLRIDYLLLFVTSLVIFAFFLTPITRGVMQGTKKFCILGTNMIIESSIKVVVGIILVIIGLKSYGGVIGIIVGSFVALAFSFFHIGKIISSKQEGVEIKEDNTLMINTFIVSLLITIFLSMDIILAKRFFTDEIAGKYAVASLMGKIIFFGTIAISKAMLPISSENHSKKNRTMKILARSLILNMMLCLTGILIYFLFPEILIKTLFGKQYLDISNIIVLTGIGATLISLSNIILLYSLSIKKKVHPSLLLLIILQVAILSIFKENLFKFALGVVISNLFLFLIIIILFFYDYKKR